MSHRNRRPALPRIRLASHRCFRDDTELRLRPLTLLYGRNQTGKSTLLRLLLLLGDSCVSTSGPLDMASPALRGASFKELGWLGPDYQATQRFGFTSDAADGLACSLRLDVVDEGTGPLVNRIVALKGEASVFDVALDSPPAGAALRARYLGTAEGLPWSGELDFTALLPTELPGAATVVLTEVRKAMRVLERIQWIQTHRLSGSSDMPMRPARFCAPTGADLPVIMQRFPDAVSKASDWLREVGIAQELRVARDSSGRPRFEVRPRSGWEFLPASLAGEGLRSLLPILVCACWAEGSGEQMPGLVAIEEPEGQLHPRLQVELARRLFVSVSRGLPVIVETHSVHVLRTMQLAVLRGELDPDDVALYWAEDHGGAASLRPIEVMKDATLRGWPPGVFEEEQELARDILQARWALEEGE